MAEHAFAHYVAEKALVADTGDPIADFRTGWDMQVSFGLANPALFVLLTNPARLSRSPALAAGTGAVLPELAMLTGTERALLPEWLDRTASG